PDVGGLPVFSAAKRFPSRRIAERNARHRFHESHSDGRRPVCYGSEHRWLQGPRATRPFARIVRAFVPDAFGYVTNFHCGRKPRKECFCVMPKHGARTTCALPKLPRAPAGRALPLCSRDGRSCFGLSRGSHYVWTQSFIARRGRFLSSLWICDPTVQHH